jgi:hypothetical protein
MPEVLGLSVFPGKLTCRFSQAPGSFSQGIPGTLAESFEHRLTNFTYYTNPVFCPYYHKIRNKAILKGLILLLF